MSANNNNEITTRFSVDISELRAGIQEANRNIRLANSEFKAATAGMNDWANSADGLSAKLRQLSTVQEQETRKLNNMRQEYQQIVAEQGESSRAAQEYAIRLNNQQAVVNRTEREIRDYTARLEEIQNASDTAERSARELGDAVESAGRDAEQAEGSFGSLSSRLAKGLGKGIASGIKAIGTATAGLVTGFLAAGEASQDFREDMGKLEAGFVSACHTSETAKKAYEDMVGVLGETDQSVEAVNHLAKLTKSEEELAKWTDIAAGVYGTFGDSLPLEGLTEAANETAKVGQVTGPLADALNWAGISEDAFNESLAKCSSEQERATLITETLSKTYQEAADIYKETNADLIEARKATSEWNEAMAEVGKVAMPVNTMIKSFGASLLTSLVPGLKTAGEGLKGLADGSEGASEKLQTGIQTAIDSLLSKLTSALPTILQVGTQIVVSLTQGIVQSLPTVADALIAMVPFLATAIVEILPQLQQAGIDIVTNILTGLSSMIPQLSTMAVSLVSELVQGLVNSIPQLVQAGVQLFTSIVQSLPTVIEQIITELPKIIDSIVSALLTAVPQLIDAGIQIFNALVQAIPVIIPQIVAALPQIIQSITSGLSQMIPQLVDGAVQLFMALIDAIPIILPPLLEALPQIVRTVVNGLVSNIPVLVEGAVQLFMAIVDAIPIIIETLVPMIPQIVQTIVTVLLENLPVLVEGAIQLFMGLVTGLMQAVEALLPMLPEIISQIATGLIEPLGTLFKGAYDIIVATFTPLGEFFLSVWNGAKEALSDVADFFGNIFGQAWENVKAAFSEVRSFFSDLWSSITDIFSSLGTTVSNIIGEAIKSVINGVIATAENTVNGGIRLLNGAIGLINKIPGVDIGRIKLVDFPRLATGGFVNGNTLAELGEQGKKEVVLPLERNLQWAKILSSQLMKEMKEPLQSLTNEMIKAKNGITQTYGFGTTENVQNVTFNQYNTSPKAMSRLDLYRQTNNLLFGAKGRLKYV